MNLTHTISVIEILWVVMALPGFVYALILTNRASADFRYLRREKINGIRDYSAFTTTIMYSTVLMIEFLFVTLGVVAMFIPAATAHVTPLAFVITFCLFTINFMMTLASFSVERRREVLIRRLAEIEGMKYPSARAMKKGGGTNGI